MYKTFIYSKLNNRKLWKIFKLIPEAYNHTLLNFTHIIVGT